jgi:signal transduction histidine kinase
LTSDATVSAEALASLAHELSTPISVIVGYAELIEKRSEEAATREAAAHIREAAEQLRAAVAQLLADASPP